MQFKSRRGWSDGYSENVINIDSLKPTRYVRNRNADNSLWSLKIKNKEMKRILSWKLLSESLHNCWCSYGWECASSEMKE